MGTRRYSWRDFGAGAADGVVHTTVEDDRDALLERALPWMKDERTRLKMELDQHIRETPQVKRIRFELEELTALISDIENVMGGKP